MNSYNTLIWFRLDNSPNLLCVEVYIYPNTWRR